MDMLFNSKNQLIVFIIVVVFANVSCSLYDYHYIYLGGDMVVIKYGRTENTSVKFDEDMPILYKLERDNYSLIAEMDLDTALAGLSFSIESDTQDELSIRGEFASTCFGNFTETLYLGAKRDPNQLYFVWTGNIAKRCADMPEPDEAARILVISMLDVSGAVIGVEEIPFTIVKTASTSSTTDNTIRALPRFWRRLRERRISA